MRGVFKKISIMLTVLVFCGAAYVFAQTSKSSASEQFVTAGEPVELIKDSRQVSELRKLLQQTNIEAQPEQLPNTKYLVECYDLGKEFTGETERVKEQLVKADAVCQIASASWVASRSMYEKQAFGFLKSDGTKRSFITRQGFDAKQIMLIHLRYISMKEMKKTAILTFAKDVVEVQELIRR